MTTVPRPTEDAALETRALPGIPSCRWEQEAIVPSRYRWLWESSPNEGRLRTPLDCTHGIVFEFDRNTRYLELWTDDESLLARPRADLLGTTVNEALGFERGHLLTESIERVIHTRRPERFQFELEVLGGRRKFLADAMRTHANTCMCLVQAISDQPPQPVVEQPAGLRDYGLTRAEREVLAQVRLGLTNEQIARRLFVSASTVHAHLK